MAVVADDVGQVLVQRPAPGDVEHLQPPADGEHRHVGGEGRVEQVDLPPVAVGSGALGLGVGLGAVAGGVDVGAPGEDQGVDGAERPACRGRAGRSRRQQDRQAAGGEHRGDVGVGQHHGGPVPHAPAGVLHVGGQPDPGRELLGDPSVGVRVARSHVVAPSR